MKQLFSFLFFFFIPLIAQEKKEMIFIAPIDQEGYVPPQKIDSPFALFIKTLWNNKDSKDFTHEQKKELATLCKEYDINSLSCDRETPLSYYMRHPTNNAFLVLKEFFKQGAQLFSFVQPKYYNDMLYNDGNDFGYERLISNALLATCTNNWQRDQCLKPDESEKNTLTLIDARLDSIKQYYFSLFCVLKVIKKSHKQLLLPKPIWYIIFEMALRKHSALQDIDKSLDKNPIAFGKGYKTMYIHKINETHEYPQEILYVEPIGHAIAYNKLPVTSCLYKLLNAEFYKKPLHILLEEMFNIKK